MRTLKVYSYEIIAALALLGVSHVYLIDPWLLPSAQMMLVALYVLIAAATEAVIASSFRPRMLRVIYLNVLVAAIISASVLMSDSSLKISAGIGIGTLILRVLVADVSLRASQSQVCRITAAFVGSTLLLETLATVYGTGERIYYDYYLYPRIKKEDYITLFRWQDSVELGGFMVMAILVLYISYRLLKYAVRKKPAMIA